MREQLPSACFPHRGSRRLGVVNAHLDILLARVGILSGLCSYVGTCHEPGYWAGHF